MPGEGFVKSLGAAFVNVVHIALLPTMLAVTAGVFGAVVGASTGLTAANWVIGLVLGFLGWYYLKDFEGDLLGVAFGLTGLAAVLQALKLTLGIVVVDPVAVAVVALIAFLLTFIKNAPVIGEYIPE